MTTKREPAAAGTRARIVEKAFDIALRGGMAAVSFGAVAEALPMSKSGLFAHFGSKDQLLVDVIELAEQKLVQDVLAPLRAAPPGIRRLGTLLYRLVDECAGLQTGGRCFLSCAVHEIEAVGGTPRTRFHQLVGALRDEIRAAYDGALAAGHLDPRVEREPFVFAVIGFCLATTWHAQLHADPVLAQKLGREQMRATLSHIAVGDAAGSIPAPDA